MTNYVWNVEYLLYSLKKKENQRSDFITLIAIIQ